MGIDMIFKIAAIGVLITIINQVLQKAGREEYATMITIAGIIIVVLMVAKEIANFFNTLRGIFGF